MNWFYVDAGQQAGPVPDEQLDEFVRTGKVRRDTLVWREGMPNWQPYSQARPEGIQPPAPVAPPPPPIAGTIPPMGTAPGQPMYQPPYQAYQPGVEYGVAYAGFWIRFVAKIIDAIIMRIVTLPLEFLPIGFASTLPRDPATWVNTMTPGALFSAAMPMFLLSMALWTLYTGFFHGKFGATPGKMALGLKVVTSDGLPIGFGRAFGRGAAEILSYMICLIGYIIAGFDPQKRALHDHIASSRVIRARL